MAKTEEAKSGTGMREEEEEEEEEEEYDEKPEVEVELEEEEEENKKKKRKKKKNREKIEVKVETLSEHPDKVSPLVGYFPSGFDPLKVDPTILKSEEEEEIRKLPRVRVFRHETRNNRLQLVVSPNGSQVDFVGTNYSGEAAAAQVCTYALGVLDKQTQTLKIVPIASNKVILQ